MRSTAERGRTIRQDAERVGAGRKANDRSRAEREEASRRVAGRTLWEVVVAMALVSVLAALLLPSIQAAREVARRLECQQNLREIGLALNGYVEVRQHFPPGSIQGRVATDVHRQMGVVPPSAHSWAAFVLPFLGGESLADTYDLQFDWESGSNSPIAATTVKNFLCPATPSRGAGRGVNERRAAGDYAADYGLGSTLARSSRVDAATGRSPQGVLGVNQVTWPSQILDGTSHTLCVTEDAGRPNWYGPRGRSLGARTITGAGWLNPDAAFVTDGADVDATSLSTLSSPAAATCPLNCTNDNEIYSFHAGGAQAVFADGSVRFMSQEIELRVLARWLTREAGDQGA